MHRPYAAGAIIMVAVKALKNLWSSHDDISVKKQPLWLETVKSPKFPIIWYKEIRHPLM
ncbi:MAG: hypothetical protein N3G48_03790 [Sulfolobales archaeon]|nr:hypothetical protein [Sulfolobales archaeon]